jgi:hypothetical protein
MEQEERELLPWPTDHQVVAAVLEEVMQEEELVYSYWPMDPLLAVQEASMVELAEA